MEFGSLLALILGGGSVTFVVTLIRFVMTYQRRLREGEFESRLQEELVGQRVLPYAKVPILKQPPPPPPAPSRNVPPRPAKLPEPCTHLFCYPVEDALGTELARICKDCDVQVTNEEWVKVGW